jgi:hypothetical protein
MVMRGSGTTLAKKGDREVHRFATEDEVNLAGATE